MSVKLLVLKSVEEIIADVKELVLEKDGREQVVGFLLKDPRSLSLSRSMTLTEQEEDPDRVVINFVKWQPFSEDNQFRIPADWVVTICEPLEKLKTSYEEHINAKERTMSVLEEQNNTDL